MPSKSPPLPILPFGDAKAEIHVSATSLGDRVNSVFPGLNAYDPMSDPTQFMAKTFTLPFPTVTVVASSMSPSLVDRSGRQYPTLMLPLSGKCSATIGKEKILWGAGHAGIFLPEYDGRIVGTGDTRTYVMLRLDPDILKRTAQVMTGRPEAQIDLRVDQGRAVALQFFGRALGPVLLQKGRMLDLQDCDRNALMMQGYDDWFNRLAVVLLCPALFGQDDVVKMPELTNRTRVINSLCDEMLADLEVKYTLTMLEQKSGYSARALQYAFKERFGCGPMEWLREQRLLRAQQRLVSGDFETISQLAHDLGFGSASQFSTAYKQRFGNSPSTYL